MAGSTIGSAPSGENTTPDGTEKIPVSGSQFVQMLNFIGRKLRETAGPTTLSMGAVADGEYLKRDGLSIVGGAGGSSDTIGNKRLSLESGVPVSTTDQTAKTTVYWTDGTTNLSVSVPATTSTPFDVYYSISGATLSTVNWTNDTTRATALAYSLGSLVKSGDTDKMYLGTGRTTGVSGQCESSRGNAHQSGGKRFLWNHYNRKLLPLDVIDTTDAWNYTTNTWRQANGATGNKVEFVIGYAEDLFKANIFSAAAISNTGGSAYVAVGVDSTSSPSGLVQGGYNGSATVTVISPLSASHQFVPAVGYHYVAWLEKGTTGTVTFEGDQAGNGYQSGLTAFLLG